ncbi:hypothetical protein HK100_001978 [Physocladia obscura]|uniref:Poly(A) RNA polymerase mitochondrial-like central palm domain-containing protein n=1 Tax=Physocladia obscura TaxID=109957 RepID=A0AAD5SWB6_9FUNG|nr:hypothetical protein HK100_001978 [Physocladia obscura]
MNKDRLPFIKQTAEENLELDVNTTARIAHIQFSKSVVTTETETLAETKITPTAAITDAPWMTCAPEYKIERSTSFDNALNHEANKLLAFLAPTEWQVRLRFHVSEVYSTTISTCIPTSHTIAFGSTGTGLFLPWSDIDLIIVNPLDNDIAIEKQREISILEKVAQQLRDSNSTDNLVVFSIPRVPVIKLIDRRTSLNIDICYNRVRAIKAMEQVKIWIASVEGLKELVMLVKLFLSSKGLSDSSKGGGYPIVSLCLAFFNLSHEVITFTIPTPDSPLPTARIIQKTYKNQDGLHRLQIMNPVDPNADITAELVQTTKIIEAFRTAVSTLKNTWDLNIFGASHHSNSGQDDPIMRMDSELVMTTSLLSGIISITDEMTKTQKTMKDIADQLFGRIELFDAENCGKSFVVTEKTELNL